MKLNAAKTYVEIYAGDKKYLWIKGFLQQERYIYTDRNNVLSFTASIIDELIFKIIQLNDKKVFTRIMLARLLMLKIERDDTLSAQQSIQNIKVQFDNLEKQFSYEDQIESEMSILPTDPIKALKLIMQEIQASMRSSIEKVLDKGQGIETLVDRRLELERTKAQFKKKPTKFSNFFSCCINRNKSDEKTALLKSSGANAENSSDQRNNDENPQRSRCCF